MYCFCFQPSYWDGKRNARKIRGLSSVGRASDLHSEGQEFESPSLQFLF